MSARNLIITIILFAISINGFSQGYMISGFVIDSISGEKLVGAHVVNNDRQSGTITNNEGYFTLASGTDCFKLTVSYIGFNSRTIDLCLISDSLIVVSLSAGYTLEGVTVKASGSDISRFRSFNVTNIPVAQVKAAPAMLGEVDLLKSIQLLPGVKSTWSGFSGFAVRGGNPDQNLILLDDIPVYNYSHFYGLFSVVNDDALQSVRLMKGALPARYGGRLSSVLDVTLKEGNRYKSEKELNIGLMSSGLMLNGPLNEGKVLYCVTARRSLYDLFTLPYNLAVNKQKSGYYFGDLSLKLTRKISMKNNISFSFFTSKDRYYNITKPVEYIADGSSGTLIRDEGYKWGNYIASVRLNKIISPRLSFNNSAYTSWFYLDRHTNDRNLTSNGEFKSEVSFSSRITDFGLKSDWQLSLSNEHRFYFGMNSTIHRFRPGVSIFYDRNIETGETISESYGHKPIDLLESSVYIEYDCKLMNLFTLNAGIRLTSLFTEGKNVLLPEPRISGTFIAIPGTRLTVFYLKTNQYFHLLRSSALELPTDLWIPATKEFPAEIAYQSGFEGEYTFSEAYSISAAVYYKEMDNLVEYKEGSSIFSSKSGWMNKTEKGSGKAYGAEFLFHKKTGKINGWVSYCVSRAERQFESINNGKVYFSSYDKRHDFSLTCNYEILERVMVGLTWVYNSGAPYSLPGFSLPSMSVHTPTGPSGVLFRIPDLKVIEERNAFRLPPYHRLDLGLTYIRPIRKNPSMENVFSVSVFNVYDRENAYAGGTISGIVYVASMFGILPSVSYKLKF